MSDAHNFRNHEPNNTNFSLMERWRWIVEGPPAENDKTDPESPLNIAKKLEFDAMWISSQEARVRVRKVAGSRVEAEALLIEAIVGGAFPIRGVPSDAEHRNAVQAACGLPLERDFQAIPIERNFWLAANENDQSKWNWLTGEFSSTMIDGKQVTYFGVQFPHFEISALCLDHGLSSAKEEVFPHEADGSRIAINIDTPQTQTAASKVGGRPTLKHGAAIAETVIMLLHKDESFSREKGVTVAHDLAKAYERHGNTRPSEKNLLSMSWEILAAVKAARKKG